MQPRLWLIATASLMFSVAQAFSTPAEESVTERWRDEAHGGVNVLYTCLRVNGVSCNYSDLVKQADLNAGPHSALTLAQLAARSGLPLRPVSLTFDELSASALPVIVHMDGESPEAGAFLLLLNISGHTLQYMNGPTATIHSIDRENFQRVWSGTALVPQRETRRNLIRAGIGFMSGFIVLLVVRSVRRKVDA